MRLWRGSRSARGARPTSSSGALSWDAGRVSRWPVGSFGDLAPRGAQMSPMALIPVRDARQSYPPFDAIFSPFKHGSIRYGRTASAADRAVLVELRRLLAVIRTHCTPPCGRCPRSTSRRSSSTPRRSRPCGGRSKPWSGRSRSSAGKRRTWPGTTGRSPRRCAGAGADAPAGARAGSWSEPLVVLGNESAGGDGAAISHQDAPARRKGGEPPARVQRP